MLAQRGDRWRSPCPDQGRTGHRLPIAGDDDAATTLVSTLLDEIGFDAVHAGTLADSWRFERDTPAYGVRMTAADVPVRLAEAQRAG